MSFAALRPALHARLTDQLSVPVYSPRAPQAEDGETIGPFPYLVVVQATETPFNTNGTRGASILVQVDGYARNTNTDSAENIITGLHAQTRAALEWAPLAVAGWHHVDTTFESMSLGFEDAGKTRRFVSLYRVTLDVP